MTLFAKKENRFVQLATRPLQNEAELQQLLHQHSSLIPIDLDGRRVSVREFPTEAGPIDNLVIDATGNVLIVEAKLACNADRRTVIAQAVDYGAQLTRYGLQALLDKVRDRAGVDFSDGWFTTQEDRELFQRELEINLNLGRFTLLIAMDKAEDRLKDAVRFLNRATHFSCLLAEVRLAELEGREVISVEVYGDESAGEKARPGGGDTRPVITRDLFVAAKARLQLGEEASAFLATLDWARENGATTGPLSSGYYLSQTPFVGNNYISWYGDLRTMDVWATADVFGATRNHLERLPGPWSQRVETREI